MRVDPARPASTNLGCRRMMLRGPRAAGIDLIAPSDLKRDLPRGGRARASGCRSPSRSAAYPTDFLAAVASTPPMDELDVIGAVRGAPVPVVKCKTVDVRVPADAEIVLEGYLDARGLVEPEGPYGEYIGYYGVAQEATRCSTSPRSPRRKDALFQTVTIGGQKLGSTDTAQLGAAKTEAAIWSVLQQAIREPVAVCCTASSGGMYNVRVSLRQRNPGEARNAIAAVFCSSGDVKHVFVVDDDIDVFSDEQIDWALATRFQADRDFVVASGFRAVPLDPSLARQPHRRQGRLRLHQAVRQGRQLRVHRAQAPATAAARTPLGRGRAGEALRPISTSWPRSAPATAARSCARSTSSTRKAASDALKDGRYTLNGKHG